MYVRESIVDDIRAHVRRSIRPEREVVGRIIMRGYYAVRYEPLRNLARGDYRFIASDHDTGLSSGESSVLVHSHPILHGYENDEPSDRDLKGANPRWFGQPYCIFHVKSDRLLGFLLMNSEEWITLPITLLEGA